MMNDPIAKAYRNIIIYIYIRYIRVYQFILYIYSDLYNISNHNIIYIYNRNIDKFCKSYQQICIRVIYKFIVCEQLLYIHLVQWHG